MCCTHAEPHTVRSCQPYLAKSSATVSITSQHWYLYRLRRSLCNQRGWRDYPPQGLSFFQETAIQDIKVFVGVASSVANYLIGNTWPKVLDSCHRTSAGPVAAPPSGGTRDSAAGGQYCL